MNAAQRAAIEQVEALAAEAKKDAEHAIGRYVCLMVALNTMKAFDKEPEPMEPAHPFNLDALLSGSKSLDDVH